MSSQTGSVCKDGAAFMPLAGSNPWREQEAFLSITDSVRSTADAEGCLGGG